MKQCIQKHINNKDFVKVYISDKDDLQIERFQGYIFKQTKDFIIMNDFMDFFYDGFVILRKRDIYEIKHSNDEKFFNKILVGEKIKKEVLNKYKELDLNLHSFEKIFESIFKTNLPVIVESKYGKDDIFQIGSIKKINKDNVKINYFNSRGEFDLKPVTAKYNKITSIKIDTNYANTFFKYAKEIK